MTGGAAPSGGWVLFAPMRSEARALRRGLPPGTPLRRTGRGPDRAIQVATAYRGAEPVAVAGIAGGLSERLRPGDLVVATEVRRDGAGTVVSCPAAAPLAAALRRSGLRVHLGPVVSADRVVDGAFRDRLAVTGALAVDTESAGLLSGAGHRSVACVRAVADVPPHPVYRLATLGRVVAALRSLTRAGPALAGWAAAARIREVLLAAPPAGCAGADVVLVVGSAGAADAVALARSAERDGTPAHLVEGPATIDLHWLAGARVVGLTAAASASPRLVDQVVLTLGGLGARTVREPDGGWGRKRHVRDGGRREGREGEVRPIPPDATRMR